MKQIVTAILFALCMMHGVCTTDTEPEPQTETYEVELCTGTEDYAGTDGDIWIWNIGELTEPNSDDEFWYLNEPYFNDFEAGSRFTQNVTSKTRLGDLEAIEIGNAPNWHTAFWGDSWLLDTLTVRELVRSDDEPLQEFTFHCNCWIDTGRHVLFKIPDSTTSQ